MKIFISILLKIFILNHYVNADIDDDYVKDSTLPSECGRNHVGRIVGGTVAKAHDWPWACALYERSPWAESDDDDTFICGSSIINRRYILTAAHCVKSYGTVTQANRFRILIGAHNRKNSGNWVKVDKVIVHPKYEDQYMQYDIALFRLKEPLDFRASNHTIAPVCVANETMSKDDLTKDPAVVIGWGTTKSMGDISDELRQVSVPVVSNKDCMKSYDKDSITDMNVCAGYKEGKKDSCQGDSGGPLAVRRKNSWVQIGITSWGRGCADKDAYGVYTRVSSHVKWVLKMIAKKPKKSKNSTLF